MWLALQRFGACRVSWSISCFFLHAEKICGGSEKYHFGVTPACLSPALPAASETTVACAQSSASETGESSEDCNGKRIVIKKGIFFLAACVVLAVIAWVVIDAGRSSAHGAANLANGTSPPSLGTATRVHGGSGVEPEAARNARGKTSSSHATLLLPDASTPTREVLAQLEPLARSGDPRAACRIALDLQDCASRKTQVAAASAMQETMRSSGVESKRFIDVAGQLLAANDRLEKKCEGVTERQIESAFDYQLIAARNNPRIASWLVSRPALDRADFVNQLDSWTQYKSFSDQYLDAALKNVDLASLPLLINLYHPDPPAGPMPISRDDPGMFLALVETAQSIGMQLGADIQSRAASARKNPSAVESAARYRHELSEGLPTTKSESMVASASALYSKPSVVDCENAR